eukprot:CAMPEP_0172779550 /NCGR_PEP_ID=MMETSP1074-20121228/202477_1 /TAXON_ID=2916 /ORGANISM="Ceratium fusus, Strain PA161109" /LENGTH=145 /DNA_ID=CAMNT_0013616513 /DNA_START=1408 /DNA_END=1845 /DNA_ORIENTATION=+
MTAASPTVIALFNSALAAGRAAGPALGDGLIEVMGFSKASAIFGAAVIVWGCVLARVAHCELRQLGSVKSDCMTRINVCHWIRFFTVAAGIPWEPPCESWPRLANNDMKRCRRGSHNGKPCMFQTRVNGKGRGHSHAWCIKITAV